MRAFYEWMTHPHWPQTFNRYFCLQKNALAKRIGVYIDKLSSQHERRSQEKSFLACHDPSTSSSRTLTIKPFVQSYVQNNLLSWHFFWQIEGSESCRRNIEKLREQSPWFSSKCFMRAAVRNLESICALSMEIVRECILNRSLLNLF